MGIGIRIGLVLAHSFEDRVTPVARLKPRRNETRQLVMPILAALNSIPGVRVWRPHVLSTSARDVSGAGLAVGSADLIGVVRNRCPSCGAPATGRIADSCGYCDSGVLFGRFFALEVKWPGVKPKPDQRLWGSIVQGLGGFWTVVHSEDEARAAVSRCRMGERD